MKYSIEANHKIEISEKDNFDFVLTATRNSCGLLEMACRCEMDLKGLEEIRIFFMTLFNRAERHEFSQE